MVARIKTLQQQKKRRLGCRKKIDICEKPVKIVCAVHARTKRLFWLSGGYAIRSMEKIRISKRFAHDEQNQTKVGDVVRVMETRPLSKLKRWRLVEILSVAAR